MRDRFVFQLARCPGFYHYAWKADDGFYHVEWDGKYKEANPIVTDCSYRPHLARSYIEDGSWKVIGSQPQEVKSDLPRAILALRMGFDALEEGFNTLRAEFERLKRVERVAA